MSYTLPYSATSTTSYFETAFRRSALDVEAYELLLWPLQSFSGLTSCRTNIFVDAILDLRDARYLDNFIVACASQIVAGTGQNDMYSSYRPEILRKSPSTSIANTAGWRGIFSHNII